jgi:acyl-CoA reductase-like NAD-dependent aldehyde dehydrogenase
MPLLMTVAEVDDALKRARKIPEAERGELWQLIVDELLERRVALATVEENVRTIRVLRAAETR